MTRYQPSELWRDTTAYHLELMKNPWYQVVAKLQSAITEATVDFWRGRGGTTLHLPITTGSISSPMGRGSDSSPVHIDLMGSSTYLADSMQFMLELGCRLADGDSYYVMPSFRGEDADSTHLCQFFHSEAEIAGGLDDVMSTVQDYLVYLTGKVLERHADAIAGCGGDLRRVEELAQGGKFEHITFEEAVGHLGDTGFKTVEGGGRTLTREGERDLMRKLGGFVWVSHWDHLSVPFYQAFADEDRKTALNADLLFGVGETVGAGERHVTREEVLEALKYHEVDEKPYEWYMDMRDLKPLRTSGFGLGVERYLMWLLDHGDIRDFQLLPRRNGFDIVP